MKDLAKLLKEIEEKTNRKLEVSPPGRVCNCNDCESLREKLRLVKALQRTEAAEKLWTEGDGVRVHVRGFHLDDVIQITRVDLEKAFLSAIDEAMKQDKAEPSELIAMLDELLSEAPLDFMGTGTSESEELERAAWDKKVSAFKAALAQSAKDREPELLGRMAWELDNAGKIMLTDGYPKTSQRIQELLSEYERKGMPPLIPIKPALAAQSKEVK